MDFGTLLRKLRKAGGKTMGQLADHLGVSVSYVSDVELGNRAPFDGAKVREAARFLRVDPTALFMAAAASRGAFELSVGSNATVNAVGAALMRAWGDLSEDDLQKISEVVNRSASR